MLELAVLGLLKEQPLHGYELRKRLSETLGFLWGVSYGSLYPALRRLERDGAIVAAEAPLESEPYRSTGSLSGDLAAARRAAAGRPRASRRTRKAYRITEAGEAAFTTLLLADDPHTDDERAFALKLAFCSHLDRTDRLAFLQRRRDTLAARLAGASRPPTRPDRYSRSLAEHRARAVQRDVEWLDELLALERTDAEADAAATLAEPGSPIAIPSASAPEAAAPEPNTIHEGVSP